MHGNELIYRRGKDLLMLISCTMSSTVMSVSYSSTFCTSGRVHETIEDSHRIGVCAWDTQKIMPSIDAPGTIFSEEVARNILQHTIFAVSNFPPINSGDKRPGADLDKTCTTILRGEANENAVVGDATVNSAAVPGESCTSLGLNRAS